MQVSSAHSASSSGATLLRPKSGRTPLRPKNTPACSSSVEPSKPKREWLDLSLSAFSNKENHRPLCAAPLQMHSLDASLAEELDAFKKKLERLRLESEETEGLLRERDLVMELQRKELVLRDLVQKELEIEVDRLFRLKELKFRCMKVSPVRTLREKERDKTMNGAARTLDMETEEEEEDESIPESVWLPVTADTLSVLGREEEEALTETAHLNS